jgi:hypothetical protein
MFLLCQAARNPPTVGLPASEAAPFAMEIMRARSGFKRE